MLSTVTTYVVPTVAGDGGVDRNERLCTILSTVISWVSLTESQFESPARVACTEQTIPPRLAVRVDPVSVHPPDCSDHETAPVDWPPVAVSECVDPVVKLLALVTENPVWLALPIVMVVLADCFANQLASCAFVARTTHGAPTSPGVRTAPEMVQVLFVPDTTDHVTTPVPEPPDEVSVRSSR